MKAILSYQIYVDATSLLITPNPLVRHLIDVAAKWTQGEGSIRIGNLATFQNLLERERMWWRKDHRGAQAGVQISRAGHQLHIHLKGQNPLVTIF